MGVGPVDTEVERYADDPAFSSRYSPLASNAPIAGIPLTLPVSDNDPSVTHPDVIRIPGGWRGYTYWMAFTPYPDLNRENPHIVASNDGVTWVVPSGGSNPIVTQAQTVSDGGAYNADTDLVYDAVNDKLVLFWKQQGGTIGATLSRIESSDGITWTDRRIVYQGAIDSWFSVAVVVEADGTYTAWGVDSTGGGNSLIKRRTSSDRGLTWSSSTTCTTPTGLAALWHMDVQRVNSRYHCLLTTTDYRVVYLTSSNGVDWTGDLEYCIPKLDPTLTDEIDYTDGGHYRCTFVPVPGDPLRWDIYAATRRTGPDSSTPWRIVLYKNMRLPAARFNNDLESAVVTRSRNNAWYVTPHASVTTATLGAGNMRLTPIYLPRCTIDEIGIEITTGVASSIGRVGIYSDDGSGRPKTLLASGTVTTTSAAFVYADLSGSPLLLKPGLYWLAFHADTASSGIGYRCTNAGHPITIPLAARPASTSLSGGISGFLMTGISAGSMPTTFVLNSGSPATPIMWVHTKTNSTIL